MSHAYREVVALLPGDMQPAQPVGKQRLTLKRIGAGILDALIGTMSPLIPAIIGAALQEAVDLVSILNSLRAARAPRGKEQNKTRAASTTGAAACTGTDATDRQHA